MLICSENLLELVCRERFLVNLVVSLVPQVPLESFIGEAREEHEPGQIKLLICEFLFVDTRDLRHYLEASFFRHSEVHQHDFYRQLNIRHIQQAQHAIDGILTVVKELCLVEAIRIVQHVLNQAQTKLIVIHHDVKGLVNFKLYLCSV